MSLTIEPLGYDIRLKPWSQVVAEAEAKKLSQSIFANAVTPKPAVNAFGGLLFPPGSPSHSPWSNPQAATPVVAPLVLPSEAPEELDFNYFGPFRHPTLAAGAAEWLRKNGADGDCYSPLIRFLALCRTKHFCFGQDAVAFTVRIERERSDFDVPNPHHDGDDGRYWTVEPGLNGQPGEAPCKLGMVLLGPGTVFYQTDDEEAHLAVTQGRQEKKAFGWSEADVRKWLDEGFAPVEKFSLKVGEIAKWRVGNDGRGTIHSEPRMDPMPEGRIFVSLVPGTSEQIKTLASNWGMPYQSVDTSKRLN